MCKYFFIIMDFQPSPNCSTKLGAWNCPTSPTTWYAEAFRVPSVPEPSPATEKQPQTIILPTPNFTLGTMQSDKYRSPGSRQSQTHQSDCQMEKHNPSLQRTCLHCSRVQWRHALHCCIQRFALQLLMYGLDAAAQPWKPIPWSSIRTVFELIWRPHEVWRSIANHVPQHPLTPLRHFMWPTTSWLSCCHSQSQQAGQLAHLPRAELLETDLGTYADKTRLLWMPLPSQADRGAGRGGMAKYCAEKTQSLWTLLASQANRGASRGVVTEDGGTSVQQG